MKKLAIMLFLVIAGALILLPLISSCQTPGAKKQAGRFALKTSLIFASGMADGTRETLKWHYPRFKAVFPGANDSYWNPSLSSNRKYKGGNPANGPAFPGATGALVWTRDGYHLMGMLRNAPMIVGITIPIGGPPRKWYTYVGESVSYYLAYTLGFTLTYDVLF